MINPEAKLAANIFDKPGVASTREGFGKGVVEAGTADERVVVLTADLAESTQAHHFQKAFPLRFIQCGVAEQNMATVAAGMALYGKIPFFTSYAAFSPGRNWEQIRTTIGINNIHAIVCGMHAGVSVGPDGATHQALEDMALMRSIPHFTVISACDAEEGRKATIAAAKLGKPVYMRWGRDKTPVMTTPDTPFEIGKAVPVWNPPAGAEPQVAVFATGHLLYQALLAARQLEGEGIAITVTNVHTIKPLDSETILREARAAGAVVTVEEHQVMGGFGSAVAELLALECPLPVEFIGVHDKFGQSGEPKELMEHYKMGTSHIIDAIKKVSARKKV
ncbi:transketolase [Candidatus Kaiserbacteria bacterium RIFCSPHIGHO2_12_FULL_55_13]|nr:MAG: transketolase [Candidatus Kaiserbacteria bacterium RIFCSPHIGHO2_12_FULL_55_13]